MKKQGLLQQKKVHKKNKNNIFRLDKSSESEDTAFKRIFSMISPREGWDTYILVLAMVCVAAWILREAEWVETPGLWLIIFLSTIVGLGTAKTKIFPWPVSLVSGILIGLII